MSTRVHILYVSERPGGKVNLDEDRGKLPSHSFTVAFNIPGTAPGQTTFRSSAAHDWIMKNLAILIVTIVAIVATRAPLPRDEPVRFTSQDAGAKFTEVNISCVLGEDCTLPCHFEGVLREAQWFKGEGDLVPFAFYPENSPLHRHRDFKPLSVNQSTGDASLLLSGVQIQDQDKYRCSNSSNGRDVADRLIHLSVHTPVIGVELQQEGEELWCRSRDVYPKPEVSWTPSTEHHTTVETTESGLYSVVSSVRLPHSPPHGYSCNVSTLHSSGMDRIKPQSSDKLSYLWILVALPLIAALAVLAWCCYKKVHRGYTPTQTDDVQVADDGGGMTNRRSHQNGYNNGLQLEPTSHTGNGQLHGEAENSL